MEARQRPFHAISEPYAYDLLMICYFESDKAPWLSGRQKKKEKNKPKGRLGVSSFMRTFSLSSFETKALKGRA